jgi:3-hydroxyisobutyrate dehydrogenase
MAADAAAPPLGFIGLGMMGLPMARSLLRHGRALLACDPNPAARDALAENAGPSSVRFASTPAAVAEEAETVILVLPDSKVVAHVVEGPGGLLPALRPGHLVIDMGSSLPAETRRLAVAAAGRGAAFLDAPVSGGVPKARDGTLAIMRGGEDAACARAGPVLREMGAPPIRTGPVGSAHAMKALNNYVYAAGLLAAAEAVHMAAALGLDTAVFTEVLNASSGRNVATETKLKSDVLSGRYAAGFQLGLMRKDLETAGAIAEETGFDAPALSLCRGLWSEAVASLGPRVDNTEIHRFLDGRRERAR